MRILHGIVFIPIVIFIVSAVSNGANLTDGLDGLAAGSSAIIVFVLGIVGLINPIAFSNINFELFYGLILVFLLLPLSLFFGGLNRSSGIFLLLLYTIFLYLQFS